jgi:hypothetical protein
MPLKKILQSYLNIPLSFENNEGQAPAEVKFFSRGGGYSLYLTSTEAILHFGGWGHSLGTVGKSEKTKRPWWLPRPFLLLKLISFS